MSNKKAIIIGSGPAGYTAAIYLARAGCDVEQIMGPQIGGQLTTTTNVENYPGFDVVSGYDLVARMQKQAEGYGVKMVMASVIDVDFSGRPFGVILENGGRSEADAVVIATGASAKWLGLEEEERFKNAGVSVCATCDGYFYKGKDVAVVGGGNTAVGDALLLANFAQSVTLIHRRDSLKAEKILQQRLFANSKINVMWNSQVIEILGTDNPRHVTGLIVESLLDGSRYNVEVSGVFVAIGHAPQTNAFKKALDLDEDGYIRTIPGSTATSAPGVFAAGDVQDKKFRQAITAAGQGCMAALEAIHYLSGH